MKSTGNILFAALALIGMVSCVALEPLHAFQPSEVSGAETEAETEHCCFVCHPNHHVWTRQDTAFLPVDISLLNGWLPAVSFERPEPPLSSIFHPPSLI